MSFHTVSLWLGPIYWVRPCIHLVWEGFSLLLSLLFKKVCDINVTYMWQVFSWFSFSFLNSACPVSQPNEKVSVVIILQTDSLHWYTLSQKLGLFPLVLRSGVYSEGASLEDPDQIYFPRLRAPSGIPSWKHGNNITVKVHVAMIVWFFLRHTYSNFFGMHQY